MDSHNAILDWNFWRGSEENPKSYYNTDENQTTMHYWILLQGDCDPVLSHVLGNVEFMANDYYLTSIIEF